jgi:peptidyl-prolyl cis-trans isomerase SurA
MRTKPLLFLILVLMPFLGFSQDLNNKVLLNVAGRDIQAGEFLRMYKKSIEPGKTLDPQEYLQQFIAFKLKVADALSEGTDTTEAFKKEFNGYRDQLSQNYLTDPSLKEKMLHEAYNRSLTEIKASHLLISVPADASPVDTIKAYQKAVTGRERIISGEPFEDVARSVSEDPSVKVNGGNLGYFTAFQMITPFENAAYSLNPGEVSQPVRTTYGYHIIKVTDKRQARGKVRVAHIMKSTPPGTTEQDVSKAEAAINDIYRQLQEGASFSDLAKRMSDHKESAAKGGEMNWFGTGEIIPEFTNAAFSLTDTGTYSKPFRSVYGWHIVKLLDKKAPASFDESKQFLESRLNQAKLSSESKDSFIKNLKDEYKLSVNTKVLKWFIKKSDTLIMAGRGNYNREKIPKGNIFTFSDQKCTSAHFADNIEKNRSVINIHDPESFVNKALESGISEQLMVYEKSILEKKYPEFRYLMGEFHDGMLLFDISGKKVWNRVSSDTIGLRSFYEAHRNDFLSPKGEAMKLSEVQGEVMTRYQDMLEKEWIGQLKEKYIVKIDSLVLKEILNVLKNE